MCSGWRTVSTPSQKIVPSSLDEKQMAGVDLRVWNPACQWKSTEATTLKGHMIELHQRGTVLGKITERHNLWCEWKLVKHQSSHQTVLLPVVELITSGQRVVLVEVAWCTVQAKMQILPLMNSPWEVHCCLLLADICSLQTEMMIVRCRAGEGNTIPSGHSRCTWW